MSPLQPVNFCPGGGGSAVTVTCSPATCSPLPLPSLTVRVCALEVASVMSHKRLYRYRVRLLPCRDADSDTGYCE